MLDRTIPYYNIIMKCTDPKVIPLTLPEGYSVSSYQDGFGNDWAEWEYAVGDFPSFADAKAYFDKELLPSLEEDPDRGVFVLNEAGKPVGSCLTWYHPKGDQTVASLHWAIVSPFEQGKGVGRVACTEALNRHAVKGNSPVYLHTQPWSWRGMRLYISMGFKLEKTDTFSKHINQYSQAMEALKNAVSPEVYSMFEENSED